MNQNRRSASRLVTALFMASTLLAAGSFAAAFVSRRPIWQGSMIGAALTCAGAAMVVWANRVLAGGPYVEEREQLTAARDETHAMEEDLERGEALNRRVWLRRSAVLAGGALVAGLIEPIRSLGPTPGRAPLRTAWANGVRVVTPDGLAVRASDVPLDGLLTVFPEEHMSDADAQVVVMRVRADDLRLPPGREGWAPEGMIAYSKVCTHAGCPVGLYQATIRQLLCPCHQSSFDVLRGAIPVSGPAAWPLPQLPLQIDGSGELRAAGPFSAPVGPGWWKE